MYNITIVFTRHEELGKCNSSVLYRIFEEINPDVIFEELPPKSFNDYYVFRSRRNLETYTIDIYTQKYRIPHVGVDSDDIPKEEFFVEYGHLFAQIERREDLDGFTLRSLIDSNKVNCQLYGFEYLNSLLCQQFYQNISKIIEDGLKKLNDEKFHQALRSWNEVNDKRENQMLKNIDAYSREHKFKNAIFTIGAAHSESIMKKISDFEKCSDSKICWRYYTKGSLQISK